MRILEKITLEKDSNGYHVYLHYRKSLGPFKRSYVLQTGDTKKTKKAAIRIAEDWLANRDFLEECDVIKFECSKYIDLTRTNGRSRENKGETK